MFAWFVTARGILYGGGGLLWSRNNAWDVFSNIRNNTEYSQQLLADFNTNFHVFDLFDACSP